MPKAKPVTQRHCKTCGQPIPRRRHPNGKLEAPSKYAQRDFCTVSCSATHQHAQARARKAAQAPKTNPQPAPIEHRQLHPDVRKSFRLALLEHPDLIDAIAEHEAKHTQDRRNRAPTIFRQHAYAGS